MSNTWNQQPMTNQPGKQNGTPRAKAGGMLREYRQQQQQHQYSPASPSPSQGQVYNPYSPIPPSAIPQQEQPPLWPPAQSWPSGRSQGWVGNAMQTVRHWSGKVVAVQERLSQRPQPVPPPSGALPS